MNRQKLALFLLLIVLAGSIGYALLRSPRQQEVAALKNRPDAPATVIRKNPAPSAQAAADTGALRLAQLDQELPGFGGFRRNIFSPIFRDEEKPPELKLPPPPPPPVKLPPPPPPEPQQAPPPPPPPPSQEELDRAEMGRLMLLGFLKKGGERTVFLTKGSEIILAKKGSKIGSRFEVVEVTDDVVTIKSLNSEAQVVIPLTENRSLGARQTSPRP